MSRLLSSTALLLLVFAAGMGCQMTGPTAQGSLHQALDASEPDESDVTPEDVDDPQPEEAEVSPQDVDDLQPEEPEPPPDAGDCNNDGRGHGFCRTADDSKDALDACLADMESMCAAFCEPCGWPKVSGNRRWQEGWTAWRPGRSEDNVCFHDDRSKCEIGVGDGGMYEFECTCETVQWCGCANTGAREDKFVDSLDGCPQVLYGSDATCESESCLYKEIVNGTKDVDASTGEYCGCMVKQVHPDEYRWSWNNYQWTPEECIWHGGIPYYNTDPENDCTMEYGSQICGEGTPVEYL